MSGCLIDLPNQQYEMHVTKNSVRLVKDRRLLKQEMFFNPEMQYAAVIRIKDWLENYKKEGDSYDVSQNPDPPSAA